MKKYLLGLFALMLIIVATAFTTYSHSNKPATSYFWYDATTGASLGSGELPSNGCSAMGSNCARGFLTQQIDPLGSTPDKTVAHN